MGKSKNAVRTFFLVAVSLGIVWSTQSAFAQDSSDQFEDFNKIEGDEIQTNPTAQQLLERIAESKRILSEMMQKQPIVTEHQKFVEEQRLLVQQNLQAEIDRMNKKYEDHSPRNAFARFVANFNATHHDIYWDQFEYMESKVSLARAAKQQVLDNGGSFQEAQREYIKFAAMSRGEMIQKIIELNVKYGFANAETQNHFDEDGKLPRYENDNNSKCYGCNDFIQIRDKIFDVELNPYVTENAENKTTLTPIILKEESVPKVLTSNEEIDTQQQITKLEQEIQQLGKLVDEEDDFEKQRILLESIAKLAEKIETLQNQI